MENRKINLKNLNKIPLAPEEAVKDFGKTLIVAPHPDDESLGGGGAIALLRKYDLEVSILVVSDGTLSHPNSIKFSKEKLRELRENEITEAAEILGVKKENITFFRYPDRSVPDENSANFYQAIRRVKIFLDAEKPQTIFVPWRRDPHPDHRAAFQLINAAKNKNQKIIEYPIWLYELAESADAPLEREVEIFRLDISSVVETKQRAIHAHRSQTTDLIDDDADGFRLSLEVLQNFYAPFEIYFKEKMKEKQTLTEKYFEDVYAANDDPWNFETSEYEAEKYAETIKALPREKYKNAFEIGCSIGVLTEKLAAKCEQILAIDVSEKALEKAETRCKNLPQINFKKMNFPQEIPERFFDLILISEVGYYLAPEDWTKASEKVFAHLNENGQIALVHWLPEVHDYPQTGDEVHDSFAEFVSGKMRSVYKMRSENYRIDVWEKL